MKPYVVRFAQGTGFDVARIIRVTILAACGALAACGGSPALPLSGKAAQPEAAPPKPHHGVAPPSASATTAKATAPASPSRKTVRNEFAYEGTIGTTAVVARFRCDQSAPCSGYYFYSRIGESLVLSPEEHSPNVFVETIGKRHTGRLSLTAGPSAPVLRGTWSSADGKRSEPIQLGVIKPSAVPKVFVRKLRESPSDDPDCYEDFVSFEVAGLSDAAIEQGINDYVDSPGYLVLIDPLQDSPEEDPCYEFESHCKTSRNGRRIRCSLHSDRPYSSSTSIGVTYLDAKILSARLRIVGDGGGAHGFLVVYGINVDLATGELTSPDAWLPEGRTVDWSKLVDVKMSGGVAPVPSSPERYSGTCRAPMFATM
jgi:hypothetical protein